MKKTNGITLIALIMTIILMLILASITVTVAINGGLFEYAGGAKDSVEIANEKDIVSEAFIWAESNSKTGRVTVDDLQKNIPTDTDATVMDNGDTLVVKFNKNNRYYEIENSGKVQGPIELVKDDYAGDITKGGVYDGSADKPFKITCIEDLVAFSIMSNGGNSELGLESSVFENQYVELTRTLDFKSIFSYNDYTTTIYNGYLEIEDTKVPLIDALTDINKYKGFIPIAYVKNVFFKGTFNGNGYSIENICENSDGLAVGLFSNIKNATIKNITITGTINTTGNDAGGIVGYSAEECIIENCINKANVSGTKYAGGIIGRNNSSTGSTIIRDCYNEGEIQGSDIAGGIIGRFGAFDTGTGRMIGCYNKGRIQGQNYAGGIAGYVAVGDFLNCYNMKEAIITSGNYAGGIVGWLHYSGNSIDNGYNLGTINGECIGGIIGYIYNSVKCRNCYTTGNMKGTVVGGIIGGRLWDDTTYNIFKNCYYVKSETVTAPSGRTMKMEDNGIDVLTQEIVDIFNTYIEADSDLIGTTEWLKWEIDENATPTFIEN